MSTVILDPTGERRLAEMSRCARPATLAGLTVGLLDISKPRGDVFLDRLEQHLVEIGASVKRFRKPTFTKPAPSISATRSQASVRWSSRHSPIEAVVRRAVCTTSSISNGAVSRACSSPPVSSSRQRNRSRPRSAFLPLPGSSPRTRSKTAPMTRCAPTPTMRSTRSLPPSPRPDHGSRYTSAARTTSRSATSVAATRVARSY